MFSLAGFYTLISEKDYKEVKNNDVTQFIEWVATTAVSIILWLTGYAFILDSLLAFGNQKLDYFVKPICFLLENPVGLPALKVTLHM